MRSKQGRTRGCLSLRVAACLVLIAGGAFAQQTSDARPAAAAECPSQDQLEPRYREWLADVELLLEESEREIFLCLTQDYQRDAYIEAFWKARDPYPETARNEKRERWQAQLIEARQLFDGPSDVRARFFLLNGPPPLRFEVCPERSAVDIEVWFYGFQHIGEVFDTLARQQLRPGQFAVIFHRRTKGAAWNYWLPGEPMSVLDRAAVNRHLSTQDMFASTLDLDLGAGCKHQEFAAALGLIQLIRKVTGSMSFVYERLIANKMERPEPSSDEWALTFASYTTDLSDEVPRLEVTVDVSYPSRRGLRTLAQIVGQIDVSGAKLGELLGQQAYAFELIGEVLRQDAEGDDALFESFRYRFEYAPEQLEEGLAALVAQRYLRPGEYDLVLRVDDLNGLAAWRDRLAITVPATATSAPSDLAPIFAEANQALGGEEASIRLVVPSDDLISGFQRFDTATTGTIDRVVFSLDERAILTKRRPPFSVDLDVGRLPRAQLLRATAYSEDGSEIASDAHLVNGSPHRFSVRLIDPVPGTEHRQSLRMRAQVTVPEGRFLERLDVFRNDDLVATLYGEPFVQPIELPDSSAVPKLALIRIVGHMDDGTQSEDAVIVNGPATMDELNIEFVELYTTVTDRDRRPITDLTEADFRVLEDGVEQTVRRFQRVENTPIRATLMLDISASMQDRLSHAVQAAARFFETVVTEKDQVSVVTFNDRPHLAVPFTTERGELAQGLLGLRAERGTALYDSLIFALYHLNGLSGQRVVLLLSDGKDESSRFDLDDALEYSRRSQAAVYAIGVDLDTKGKGDPRKVLTQLSRDTGGIAYFIDDLSELDAIYQQIALELRSKYLLAYQSSNDSGDSAFRKVEVEVARKGAQPRTLQGYYP